MQLRHRDQVHLHNCSIIHTVALLFCSMQYLYVYSMCALHAGNTSMMQHTVQFYKTSMQYKYCKYLLCAASSTWVLHLGSINIVCPHLGKLHQLCSAHSDVMDRLRVCCEKEFEASLDAVKYEWSKMSSY